MGLVLARSSITRGFLSSGIASYEMDLYIYQGTQTTDRADGVYYALYGPVVPSISSPANNETSIDISSYIRDFIESTYDGIWTNSDNDAVWVDYRTRSISDAGVPSAWSAYTQYYCSEGYGYFNETQDALSGGYVHETEPNESVLLTTGTTLYVPDGELLTIPINRNELNLSYYPYFTDGSNTEYSGLAAAPRAESTDLIYYWTEDGNYDYTQIKRDNDAGADVLLNYIERVTEYKGTPIKIVFKNKFGALQEMWFFGKTTVRTSTSKDQFNRKSVSTYLGLVDSTKHAKAVYNKKGAEHITLNSGFQVEANNELFRQLFLSEYVWMHYEGDVLPVNVTDSDIQYKTSINDKLINYTINFEFAFEKILV